MKLLLFDIDLTLINSAGAGRKAMAQAFHRLFGTRNGLDNISFAGRTDAAIFREAVDNQHLEWQQAEEDEFKSVYCDMLREEIEKPNPAKHVEPGVQQILKRAGEEPMLTLGLLTGNWKKTAMIKLSHFGLEGHFELGAFSDDSEVRAELPGFAAERFRQLKGTDLTPENVYIIGDTPLDVACARPFGATSVAVATGLYGREELQAAKPDHLLNDLSDTQRFFQIFDRG